MLRTKNFVLGLMIAACALSGACASMGSRSISEVKTNPGKFHDKTVTVEGVVTTSFGIRIAQLLLVPCLTPPVEVVEELPPSADGRGEAGFGSSGR